MNEAQIGSADFAPSRPSSELSSKPTHTTQTMFGVYPANQPSRDVPVFPAAVPVNPIARAREAVPLLSTSCMMLVISQLTSGLRACRVCDFASVSPTPSEFVTRLIGRDSESSPPFAKAV